MRKINLDGAERNIFRNCVMDIWMVGKNDKLKKGGHRTVYRMDELEEYNEEVEGEVIGNGGEDVSIVPVVYPRGAVSVSSLGFFRSIGYYYKPSHPHLPVFLGARHIQEYFKNKRGRKRKFIKVQQENTRNDERMNRSKVLRHGTKPVGYWELIPMESGARLLSPQDISTVRVAE